MVRVRDIVCVAVLAACGGGDGTTETPGGAFDAALADGREATDGGPDDAIDGSNPDGEPARPDAARDEPLTPAAPVRARTPRRAATTCSRCAVRTAW
jgi:hypothetical protein